MFSNSDPIEGCLISLIFWSIVQIILLPFRIVIALIQLVLALGLLKSLLVLGVVGMIAAVHTGLLSHLGIPEFDLTEVVGSLENWWETTSKNIQTWFEELNQEVPDGPAPDTAPYIVGANNANGRICPQLDCYVVVSFPPGSMIDVLSIQQGEEAFGSSDWLYVQYSSPNVYIHSSLASPVGQQPEPLLRVGIQAGHVGNDSGSTCPDGLTEASIAESVAGLAVERLATLGYEAEMLTARRENGMWVHTGWSGDAFVSLHMDQCGANANGYKIARRGGLPGTGLLGNGDLSDKLVESLWEHYGAATGLRRDDAPGHFTTNMLNYYALRSLKAGTPAAIVEMAWLSGDREFATSPSGQSRMADGITQGVHWFLSN